jgi:hypothetical protein
MEDTMKDTVKGRNLFVRSSFERKNQLGKGKTILSDRDRVKTQRSFRKKELRREMKGGSYENGPFFFVRASAGIPGMHVCGNQTGNRICKR